MSTPTHNQYTLLHEDEDTKILYEFKALVADDVVQHIVDFLKGCGYMESTIFECMKELSEMYFASLETQQFIMSTGLQVQQQGTDLD